MSHRQRLYSALFFLTIICSALFIGRHSAQAQDDGRAILRDAWANTERAGSYDFVTQMTETRNPAPRLTAIGRSPEVTAFYVEGTADRNARRLDLRLWDDPNSLHDAAAAYEVRIDGTTAQGRVQESAWTEIDDFSGTFAPAGDAAMFLASAENVRPLGTDSREIPGTGRSVTFERYAFTLDSDGYANQMRAVLQAQLQESGELPAGMTLSASEAYRNMFAEGEAWIDSDGMPLRLVIDMQFAQAANGERNEVRVQTDFTSYNDQAAIGRIRIGNTIGGMVTQSAESLTHALNAAVPAVTVTGVFFLLFVGLVALQHFRPKMFHNAFATVLSAQLAFAPLFSIVDLREINQFYEHNPAMRVEQVDETEQTLAMLAAINPDDAAAWQQPLESRREQAEQINAVLNYAPTADEDSDGDNLSDESEALRCPEPDLPYSNPANSDFPSCTDPNNADTDNDGLTDGEELLILGTYPNQADSDNDGLSDYVEVRGFLSMGQRKYSDPLSPDTDGDLNPDGIECSDLQNVTHNGANGTTAWTTNSACNNTDPSTHADLLVLDEDGDGVAGRLDLSPLTQIVPNGGQFDRNTPLNLTLSDVAANKPVLVDLQLRPIEEHQLSFALNYLDWPSGDGLGQVQRYTDSTFGSVNDAPLDHPSRNGDMQITPMLEVTLPGNSLDLPRKSAEIDIPITDIGRIMATVFISASNGVLGSALFVESVVHSPSQLTIAPGTCTGGLGTALFEGPITDDMIVQFPNTPPGVFGDGGHIARLVSNGITHCVPIPDLVEGADDVRIDIQSAGTKQADIHMVTSGGTNTTFTFSNLAATYDARVVAGNCQEQTSTLGDFADISNGIGRTLSGHNVSQLGDANHAVLFLADNTTDVVACAVLPNIINGTLTGANSATPEIDQAALQTYGLNVQETESGQLVMSVPLSLAIDQATGERSAFNGRLYFNRSTTAPLNATVHLVWIVTALTDQCPQGDCAHGAIDQQQIIHTYRDEAWRVTGLRVEEEIRYDVAMIYEDPAHDFVTEGMSGTDLANRDLQVDDNLWALVRGFEGTLLPGRDIDGNSVRDYSVQFLEAVFDTNNLGSNARFGISADALNVETYNLGEQANISQLMNSEIPNILNTHFLQGELTVPDTDLGGTKTVTVKPTLLFAAEHESRALDLDAQIVDAASNLVTVNNNAVTLSLDSDEVPASTFASVSWKPFQYGSDGWEAAPIETYLESMSAHLQEAEDFIGQTEEAQFEADGSIFIAQSIYLSYYAGRANGVAFGSDLAWQFDQADGATDAELAAAMNSVRTQAKSKAGIVKSFVVDVAQQIDAEAQLYAKMYASLTRDEIFDGLDFGIRGAIGRSYKGQTLAVKKGYMQQFAKLSSSKKFSKAQGAAGVVALAATTVAAIGGSFFSPSSDNNAVRGVGLTLKSINTANEIADAIKLVGKFNKFQAGNATVKGLSAFAKAQKATRAAKIAAVIGLVIEIGAAVGAFIFQVLSAELGFFSLQFNQLAANATAAVVLAVLLAALATTGVGLVIVTILGVLDALIFAFCAIPKNGPSSAVGKFICKGISGLLTEAIAYAIYDNTPITTIDDPNRIASALDLDLVDDEAGFIAGATLDVMLAIRNTLQIGEPDSALSEIYGGQFNEDNLRSASFVYQVATSNVTEEDQQLHKVLNLELDEHTVDWQQAGDGFAITRTYSSGIVLPTAGLNRRLAAFNVEGVASPVQECVLIPNPLLTPPAIPTCWVRSDTYSTYSDLQLDFDIFPATLDEFYTLVDKEGGKALAWGQVGAVTFPRLQDADGDGLIYSVDSDDGDSDNDNDGVTDLKEMEIGTNPDSADSDNDGAFDNEELQRGTNPLVADTDGDGIQDGDEADGWLITYNIAGDTTRAWPNPVLADEDQDGVIDRVEKGLGTNPRVESSADALAYQSTLREEDAPLLWLRFDEAANATSFADSAQFHEQLYAECEGEACPVSAIAGKSGNALSFNGTTDLLSLDRDIPEINTLENDFTLAAWIYPNDLSDQMILGTSSLDLADGFRFNLFNGQLFLSLLGTAAGTASSGIVAGEWQHVAVTAAAVGGQTEVRFYVDGQLVGSPSTLNIAGIDPDQSDNLLIGGNQINNNQDEIVTSDLFDGLLDEVVVYGRVIDSAEITQIMRGIHNVHDDNVQVGDQLTFATTIENQLLGRTASGLLQTELPNALIGTPNNRNFTLTRDDGSASNTLEDEIALTVAATDSGDYEIVQAVGALIDVPTVPLPSALAAQVLQAQPVVNFNGTTDYTAFNNSNYQLGSGDFTFALWVNPASVAGTRAVLGHDSGEIDGYATVQIVDGKIRFGFGDDDTANPPEWHQDTTANAHVSAGVWTHIAISYDRSEDRATVFINGSDANDDLTFTDRPGNTGGYFELGRSTNLMTVDFGSAEIRCEDDSGGPTYDLVANNNGVESNLWSEAFIDDVEETNDRFVNDIAPAQPFRNSVIMTMCENDSDNSNHATCDGNDDEMGELTFHYYEADRNVTDHTFSTDPDDPTCSARNFDDWIEVDYSVTTHAQPFAGAVKDLRLIKSTLNAQQVTDLFQSDTLIANFRLNDRPGSQLFDDEIGGSVGSCSGATCPLTGVQGRENVAAEFDGINDRVDANAVSTQAFIAANSGNFALSFGAWVKPADDFHLTESAPFIAGFHDVNGNNRIMLGLIAEGDDAFKVRVFESNNQSNDTTQTFGRGVWHHVFVTIDYTSSTNNATIWVNGNQELTFSTTSKPIAPGRFSFGQEWDGNTPSNFFKGAIDDVVVTRNALNFDGISEIMRAAPQYQHHLDLGERYFTLDSVAHSNTSGLTKLYVDDQLAAYFGTPFPPSFRDDYENHDFPISPNDAVIDMREVTFGDGILFGSIVVDATTPDGSYSQTFTRPNGTDMTVGYTLRSADSTDPAVLSWFAQRAKTDRGQIGGALSYDGFSTSGFVLPESSYGSFNNLDWTMTAWVKPTDMEGSGDVYRPIVAADQFDNSQFHFIGLKNGLPHVKISGITNGTNSLTGSQQLPPDVWSQIVVRWLPFDTVTLFVNGSQVASTSANAGTGPTGSLPLLGAGFHRDAGATLQHFAGSIDATSFYDKALSNEEIAKLYNFQASWQDETESYPFTLDRIAPTWGMGAIPAYIPNQPIVIAIEAFDEHSAPVGATVDLQRFVSGAYTTVATVGAPICAEIEAGDSAAVFCPQIAPPQEGRYKVTASVYDTTGNVSDVPDGGSDPIVLVDGSAPNLTLTTVLDEPIQAQLVAGADSQWTISLAGVASDPNIDPAHVNVAGSGVAGVTVRLFDANGAAIGEQTATANGATWSIDYLLTAANPTGTYTGLVTAVDHVDNDVTLPIGAFQIDGTAPEARVDGFDTRRGAADSLPFFLNRATVLSGSADEQPAATEFQADVSGVANVEIAVAQQFAYGSPTQANPLPNSALLYLPFDKSEAVAGSADTSFADIVAGRSATCTGDSCPLSGISSPNAQALQFDGVDDVLELSSAAQFGNLANDFTIGAWIKTDGNSFGRIVSTDRTNFTGGYGLAVNGTGLWLTTYGVRDYVTASGLLTPNVWQHVAVHLTSNNDAAFYVNGVLVETVTHNSPAVTGANNRLLIGATTDLGANAATIQHFKGALDSVVVTTGKPTGTSWDAVFGMQPTVHLPFDALNVVAGGGLQDASGMGTSAIFASGDSDNHAIVGTVGVGALELTAQGEGINVTAQRGALPYGDESFTIALWLRDMNSAELTYGSNKVTFSSNNLVHTFNGSSLPVSTGASSGWHHFTFVYDSDAGRLRTYRNGAFFSDLSVASSGLSMNETTLSFTRQSPSATIAIDDLRVYQRPLLQNEIRALAESGWTLATINARAPQAESATWSGTLPDNVEGFYDLFVRGSDVVGNVDEEPRPAWSGIIDTKEPTLFITEIPNGGSFQYSLLALDFAIDENRLTLPSGCTNQATTLRETNQSPWALAIGEQIGNAFELVNALEVTCESGGQLSADAVFGICDLAGNCVYQHPDGSTVPLAVGLSQMGQQMQVGSSLVLIAFGLLAAAFVSLLLTWRQRRR